MPSIMDSQMCPSTVTICVLSPCRRFNTTHTAALDNQHLRRREIVLGKGHPDTLTSMSNLANVLSDEGKYKEAEEMH
jgi:hypothetical protein